MSFKIDNVGNLDRKNIVDNGVNIDISALKTKDARNGLKKLLKFFDKADGVEDGILGKAALNELQKRVGKKIDHQKLASALNDCFKEAAEEKQKPPNSGFVMSIQNFEKIVEVPDTKHVIYITNKELDSKIEKKIVEDLKPQNVINLPGVKVKKNKRKK